MSTSADIDDWESDSEEGSEQEEGGGNEPYWKRQVETYNKRTGHGSTTLHLLFGSCDAELLTRDDECEFQARYRKVETTDDGVVIEERCGTHVPDEWLDGTPEPDSYVLDLRAECGKTVEKHRMSGEEITAVPLGEDEARDIEVPDHIRKENRSIEECGRPGFISFFDTDGICHTFCKSHARDVWLSGMRSDG